MKSHLENLDAAQLDAAQLVERLGAEDWPTREAASSALAVLGEASLDALIAGLSHPQRLVRAACAGLMDHLADARCEAPLQRALHDPSPHVRRHAVHSLSCQTCKIAPLELDVVGLLVERVLTDSSPRVRRVAVHQLGLQPHDARAIDALQNVLRCENDDKILSRARFALQNQQRN